MTSSGTQRPRIKICGITRPDDAIVAVEAGVDLVGLNFYPPSPRSVSPERGREIVDAVADRFGSGAVRWVGVFVDEPTEKMLEIAARVGLDLLQFHGDEPPEAVEPVAERAIRAFRVNDRFEASILRDWLDLDLWGLLVDSRHPTLYGGTGEGWDFSSLRAVSVDIRLLIAGGLRPDNVADAVVAARPWGVDLASGVESAPGVKDPRLVRRVVEALEAPAFSSKSRTFESFPHEETQHG